MTTGNLLSKFGFERGKSEGCNCTSTGKADVYRKKDGGIEARLYAKKKKFKITRPGHVSLTGTFSELERTLETLFKNAA
jgi:hypothetical protein